MYDFWLSFFHHRVSFMPTAYWSITADTLLQIKHVTSIKKSPHIYHRWICHLPSGLLRSVSWRKEKTFYYSFSDRQPIDSRCFSDELETDSFSGLLDFVIFLVKCLFFVLVKFSDIFFRKNSGKPKKQHKFNVIPYQLENIRFQFINCSFHLNLSAQNTMSLWNLHQQRFFGWNRLHIPKY